MAETKKRGNPLFAYLRPDPLDEKCIHLCYTPDKEFASSMTRVPQFDLFPVDGYLDNGNQRWRKAMLASGLIPKPIGERIKDAFCF